MGFASVSALIFFSNLFNLSGLKPRTKVSQALKTEIFYADDLSYVTESAERLQRLLSNFYKAYFKFSLQISVK